VWVAHPPRGDKGTEGRQRDRPLGKRDLLVSERQQKDRPVWKWVRPAEGDKRTGLLAVEANPLCGHGDKVGDKRTGLLAVEANPLCGRQKERPPGMATKGQTSLQGRSEPPAQKDWRSKKACPSTGGLSYPQKPKGIANCRMVRPMDFGCGCECVTS
jgi:hypothetical protein